MSTFADLGHPDLADDVDHEIDPLDVLGPVTPPAAPAVADRYAAPEMYSPAWHAAHAGLCGTWCLPDDERPAPPPVVPDEDAAARVRALVARRTTKGYRRPRTATPAPEVPCRPAVASELPAGAAALLADVRAAGWSAVATYSLGPLPSEQSRCGVCGTWSRINLDGSLARHRTEARPCDGAELDADGRCTTCSAKAKPLKRGGLSKHKAPAGCDNTTLDPDADTWQMKPCVVVRARSPHPDRPHHVAAAWTDGSADGAWLVLAGPSGHDRPRRIGHNALRATFRRLAATAPTAPSCPLDHPVTDGAQPEPAREPAVAAAAAPSGAPAGVGEAPAVLETQAGAQRPRLKSAHSCRVCSRWLEGEYGSAATDEARADLLRQMDQGGCDECLDKLAMQAGAEGAVLDPGPITLGRGQFGIDHVGDAVEVVEHWNCSRGCVRSGTAKARAEFGPGGDCDLLASVAAELPVEEFRIVADAENGYRGRRLECTAFEPAASATDAA